MATYPQIQTPTQVMSGLNLNNLNLDSGIKNIPTQTTTESAKRDAKEERKKKVASESEGMTQEEIDAEKQAYKEALEEAKERNAKNIANLILNSSSLDADADDYNATQLSLNQQIQQLEITNLRIDKLIEEADKKDEEGNDKWGLKEYGALVALVGGGLAIGESLDRLINSDDLSEIDVMDELRNNAIASTDPEVMDMIINASYRDQPKITDLENLSNYRNQFGSLSNEMFNDSTYGAELETSYQEFLKDNPGVGRDQFLTEFARANPMNPLSQLITNKLSRMGQLEKSAGLLAEIDRNQQIQGFDTARNFFKPIGEGGLGFTPEEFRTPEQQRVIDRTMGLMDSEEARLLRDSVANRVRSGGQLGIDEMRDITSDALTSVDPSLANQQYLKSGGLARSILNTTKAKRDRLMQDESALNSILNSERSFMPVANSVVQSNTIDPVRAFGLTGSNTATANQIYTTNPTQGANYDPTSSYFSSLTGINANIRQANELQPSNSSEFNNISDNLNSMSPNYDTIAS